MAEDTGVSIRILAIVGTVALVVGGTVGAVTVGSITPPTDSDPSPGETAGTHPAVTASVSTFDSRAAFRRYLSQAPEPRRRAHAGGTVSFAREDRVVVDATEEATVTPRATPAGSAGGMAAPRVSRTNVQVPGIDEPDRLKGATDAFFYSPERHGHIVGTREAVARPADRRGRTYLLNASDPTAPAVTETIEADGKLLLVDDTLVVFEDDRILGYDVTDRSDPDREWTTGLDGRVVTARLYEGHVYVVTAQTIDHDDPCPIEPVAGGEVGCTAVHHPGTAVPVDRTYVVSVIDPETGTVENATGFVGTADQSAVYMSENAVYLTYTKQTSRADLMVDFLLENQSDRLDDRTRRHLHEIRGYNLSERAKRQEVMATYREWLRTLDAASPGETREAIQADLHAWMADHKRELRTTGIVEFAIESPEGPAPSVGVDDVGTVPGRPLDQFALDEHEGHLRIATTVEGAFGADSANDVYVLDDSLSIVGSVQGMGLTERIYAVRFRGEEAYVVTFRRIDPFHVLDLSDPEDPSLEGELKLPGFSSYLHSLDGDRVLGVGEEDGRVKLVVFDVADPTDPTILTSRVLDARWSAVSRTHHAFLRDPRHGVFFLPTAGAGLVYDEELHRVATVSVDGNAQRAAYIGDSLYVFGEGSVTVVDETSWNTTGTVDLQPTGRRGGR